ncbi:MAG: glucose-1-phosphate adenylyltransferase subunit GlgD [Clostridia bacterium]|nr:glucose-1-phosphate adenylyltransferase subunit GlgD [Clostridia bacterium]
MNGNTVLGLLFPNMHDDALPEFTRNRAMGSVPFGGRYRLVDFTLSNLVNAGVSKVGVVTKSNYQSMMDHLGSGKAWDLSRKAQGLYFLPPFGASEDQYDGRIAPLAGVRRFLENSRHDYVILSDCHIVGNIDYRRLVEFHVESGADITVACLRGTAPENIASPIITANDKGRITDMIITRRALGEALYGIGLYVVSRTLLMQLVENAVSRNQYSFEWDVLQRHIGDRHLYAYEIPEFTMTISSLAGYFKANMALLDPAVREKLFVANRPIYTKVRDCAPALYGLHAQVADSLVADGCKIDGAVRDSILFRDVHVDRDAVIDHCILMQGSVIGAGSTMEYIITDKNVCIRDRRSLKGCADYPVSVKKGTMV